MNRSPILLFAQSIAKIIQLWNIDHTENNIFSAVVYAKGNYTITDEVYISVPVKFEKGSFYFIKNFTISSNKESVIDEIVQVKYSMGLNIDFINRLFLFCLSNFQRTQRNE